MSTNEMISIAGLVIALATLWLTYMWFKSSTINPTP